MNIAESMKHVLKSQRNSLFTNFWKDDLRVIFTEMKNDLGRSVKNAPGSLDKLKETGLKKTFGDLLDSGVDTLVLLKQIPERVKRGFHYFREDLLLALENLPDQKQKTIFCIKVVAALSSFGVNAFYSIRKTQAEFSIKGLRRSNALTQYIMMELIFRVSQLFIIRFLSEVEKHMTDKEDIKHVRFVKSILSDSARIENEGSRLHRDAEESGDQALRIVDSLRIYIMTGQRDDRRKSA